MRFPTKPTLNSRPATYSWTRTSSNCSSICATRRLRARLLVHTAPLSIPTLASSAAGFTIADDQVFKPRVAVDPLAQVEDQIGSANPGEPAEVAIANR